MGRDTCERNAAEWRATYDSGVVLISYEARETQGELVTLLNNCDFRVFGLLNATLLVDT